MYVYLFETTARKIYLVTTVQSLYFHKITYWNGFKYLLLKFSPPHTTDAQPPHTTFKNKIIRIKMQLVLLIVASCCKSVPIIVQLPRQRVCPARIAGDVSETSHR